MFKHFLHSSSSDPTLLTTFVSSANFSSFTSNNYPPKRGQHFDPSSLVTRATSQLVTGSCINGHVVTRSTHHRHVLSHSQLPRAHDKTTSTSRNYLHAVRRHPETVLNTEGVITAICVTLMTTADSRSRRQITLLRKARSTRHNAVFWNTTVNSSHDFTMWRVDWFPSHAQSDVCHMLCSFSHISSTYEALHITRMFPHATMASTGTSPNRTRAGP